MQPPQTRFEIRVYNATADLVIAKATGHELKEATYLALLALAYWEEGQMYQVIRLCKEAVPIFKKLGYKVFQRKFLNYLAEALMATDQDEEALPYLEEQLALVEQTANNLELEAYSLRRLGYHYLFLDRPVTAIPYFKQAADRYTKLGQHSQSFELLNQIGLILIELNELVEAGQYFYRALAAAQLSRVLANEGHMLNNLGWLYLRMGHAEEGQRFYQHALNIFREVGDKISELKALKVLDQIYLG
jgi:tetratricopeptide (TPR) repeat protein